jgi:hypothetical protein
MTIDDVEEARRRDRSSDQPCPEARGLRTRTAPSIPDSDASVRACDARTEARPDAITETQSYEWTHTLGDIVTALGSAGLRIAFLHEHPFADWQLGRGMQRATDGYYRFIDPSAPAVPLMYSIKATLGSARPTRSRGRAVIACSHGCGSSRGPELSCPTWKTGQTKEAGYPHKWSKLCLTPVALHTSGASCV